MENKSSGDDETGEGGAASLTGGYEYDFVENPPEDMSCSICLHVLRDPVLTSCCGNHFCQSCIDRIRVEGNPCPLCQTSKRNFQVMLDKFFQRKVKELKIKCPNSEHGCEWVGELGDIEKHIDTPSGCKYVEVLCDYSCGSRIPRRNLAEHKTDYCLLRPFTCEYCQLQRSYKYITKSHWRVCKKYPVECPNECGIGTIERKHLDKHVQEECPLTVVDCEFKIAGCSAQLPRKDMPQHTSDYISVHLSMVPGLIADLQQGLRERDEKIAHLQKQLDEKIADLKTVVSTQLGEILDHLQLGSPTGAEATAISPSTTTASHPLPQYLPVEFIMNDLAYYKGSNIQWFSDPFYTHPGGYTLCLSVFANGIGKGNNTHISVFANLMRGEYDDNLDWPFRGSIHIKLVNHGIEETVKFRNRKASGRVLVEERNTFGQGNPQFATHSEVLYNQYLHFRVCSVDKSS